MVDQPRKRNRDYRLEEERRNIRARALGFTSRAAQRRATERGIFPPARVLRTDPQAAAIVEQIREANFERQSRDAESRRWSRIHSRQRITQWSDSWSRRRKDDYYQAFVRWWSIPNDERDFTDVYDYMMRYGVSSGNDFSDNPYRNRD